LPASAVWRWSLLRITI